MGRYNIIKRVPKNLDYSKTHNSIQVYYQVDNEPEIHKIDMVNLLVGIERKNVYWSDKSSAYKISTDEERDEFIKELKLFSKGGSYRKSHPIVYSEIDKIKRQIGELQEKLEQLNEQEEKEASTRYIEEYNKLLNNKDKNLNKFLKQLDEVISNERYKIIHSYESFRCMIVLFDNEIQLPIKIIDLKHSEIRDLTDDEKISFMMDKEMKGNIVRNSGMIY